MKLIPLQKKIFSEIWKDTQRRFAGYRTTKTFRWSMKQIFLFCLLQIAYCLFLSSCSTPGNIQNQKPRLLIPARQTALHTWVFSLEFFWWQFAALRSHQSERISFYPRRWKFRFKFFHRLPFGWIVWESNCNWQLAKIFSMLKKENSSSAIVTVEFLSNRNIECCSNVKS